MNVTDVQPIRLSHRQVVDKINLGEFYEKLVKQMKMEKTDYLKDMCYRTQSIRQMCTSMNMQQTKTYVQLYKECLLMLKAMPWNDQGVQKLIGQGFCYKDTITGITFKPASNIAYDIITSLYNATASVIYECTKRTQTEEGLKQKADQYLEASYYCETATKFIKQNQKYVQQFNDIYIGHSVFTGYQNLFLAMCLECYANVVILRTNNHPEHQQAFADKLKQYWGNSIKLYQQARIQLGQIIQLDKTKALERDIDQKLLNCKAAYNYLFVLINKDTNKSQAIRDVLYVKTILQQMQQQHFRNYYVQLDQLNQIEKVLHYDPRLVTAAQETQVDDKNEINFSNKLQQMKLDLPLSLDPEQIFIPYQQTQALTQIRTDKENVIKSIEQHQTSIGAQLQSAQNIVSQQEQQRFMQLQKQIKDQNIIQQLQQIPQMKENISQTIQQFEVTTKKFQDLLNQDQINQKQFGMYWNSQQAVQLMQQYISYGNACVQQLKGLLTGEQIKYLSSFDQEKYQKLLNYDPSQQVSQDQQNEINNIKQQYDKIQQQLDQIQQYNNVKSMIEIYDIYSDKGLSSRHVDEYAQELALQDKQQLQKLKKEIIELYNELVNRVKQYNQRYTNKDQDVENEFQELQKYQNTKQSGETYLSKIKQDYEKFNQTYNKQCKHHKQCKEDNKLQFAFNDFSLQILILSLGAQVQVQEEFYQYLYILYQKLQNILKDIQINQLYKNLLIVQKIFYCIEQTHHFNCNISASLTFSDGYTQVVTQQDRYRQSLSNVLITDFINKNNENPIKNQSEIYCDSEFFITKNNFLICQQIDEICEEVIERLVVVVRSGSGVDGGSGIKGGIKRGHGDKDHRDMSDSRGPNEGSHNIGNSDGYGDTVAIIYLSSKSSKNQQMSFAMASTGRLSPVLFKNIGINVKQSSMSTCTGKGIQYVIVNKLQ